MRDLDEAVNDAGTRLERGLIVLASVGSSAPYIGLLGTVWGVYHALVSIGLSGQGTLDKVAGPVGEALIMTAFGLAVAIPAVLGYNALLRANRVTVARLNVVANRVIRVFTIRTMSPATTAHATSSSVEPRGGAGLIMALGMNDKAGAGAPLAEINMIPLIDVMLVLLVIFIVTAPLLTHAVRIELPRASSAPITDRPEAVALAIDAQGATFWNGEPVARAELLARMAAAAKRSPQPELHLSVDRSAQYQGVAEIMAAAAKAGLTRIGFVADPRDRPGDR